jgi:phospholipid-binding lipoprotein MlaA
MLLQSLTLAKSTLILGLLAGVSACTPASTPAQFSDPDEAQNRDFHDLNVVIDKYLLRPVAKGVDAVAPDPILEGVSNFADNLDMPKSVVNNLLQFRLAKAAENMLRFALNTTIGIGGLFDPATALGIPGDASDFGETLHIWGMPEGDYAELPLLGPTTDRDSLGSIVDLAMNPLRLIIPAQYAYVPTAAQLGATIGDRGRYSETFDSILYDSADGYAQARLLYLQNRRFELGMDAADDPNADPYEDPYAE